MTRIGVVGTDNTHVDHIVRYFNAEQRAGEARVVAVAAATRDVGLPTVARVEDLIGRVDVAVVADRDGELHAEHAIPLLRAGLPVLVDKPLASSVADAQAIVEAAESSGAPVTSYSALRWLPAIRELAGLAEPRVVVTTGPVDPASPYGGVRFYGIHLVEMALALCDGELGEVRVTRTDGATVVTTTVGATAVVVSMVHAKPGDVPFHALVSTPSGVQAREVEMGADYLYPALDAFVAMVRTGVAPLTGEQLLQPIRLLAAVTEAAVR